MEERFVVLCLISWCRQQRERRQSDIVQTLFCMDVPDPTTELRGKRTAKMIAVGQTVVLQFRNGNSALSSAFLFTRGAK